MKQNQSSTDFQRKHSPQPLAQATRQVASDAPGNALINEAIKRILLDIVVRGHGDRLIGRWSREPELERFLEQVPYMLDRINQLHLACTRGEHLDQEHVHHYHHHQQRGQQAPALGQSSLHDFVSLIGDEHHWLVRTRDPLGLTPLHKAVLFNNRQVAEYILDRYPDELAAPTRGPARAGPASSAPTTNCKLIDAQDKYGRTALHYAAAFAANLQRPAAEPGKTAQQESLLASRCHLYQFLLAKGASARLQDFRGKRPAHYLTHPSQLRAKSIIHLANKLSANYQANVLTKTLRAAIDRRPLMAEGRSLRRSHDNDESCDNNAEDDDDDGASFTLDGESSAPELRLAELQLAAPGQNRESMSVSCSDLRQQPSARNKANKIHRTTSHSSLASSGSEASEHQPNTSMARAANGSGSTMSSTGSYLVRAGRPQEQRPAESDDDDNANANNSNNNRQLLQAALKQLRFDRTTKLVVALSTRQNIVRCLSEGNVDKVNEVLVEGHGEFLVREAPIACWNQACKRYIGRVVPDLLRKLDYLHELIATNQLDALETLLVEEPILARIKRPYRRASLGAIHLAVQLGRKSVLKFLVDKFPELINQRDSLGATCLHWAAKSLKHDRLYCWLLEHFGPQLEHLRDFKGRTAADNRQQAIRHSSFELGRLSTPLDAGRVQQVGGKQMRGHNCHHPSAAKLMRQTQRQSNELHIGGQKAQINSRKGPRRVASPSPTDEQTRATSTTIRSSDDLPPTNGDGDGEDSLVSNLDSDEAQEEAEAQDGAAQSGDEAPGRGACGFSGARQGGGAGEEQADEEGGEMMSKEILDEMVQLEPDEEANESSEGGDMALRPLSAQSLRKLGQTILDCVQNNDFEKLEHLILAGFGRQISRMNLGARVEVKMSSGMREFLSRQLNDYMDDMATVHRVLHECYAHSIDNDSVDRVNERFHKLCNLMMENSNLIMCRDQFGASPLHVAIVRCDKRLIDYLVRRQPEAASGPDYENRNAIHYAAIVLASMRAHSSSAPIRLTNSADKPEGFWELDLLTINEIYLALCSRYANLIESRDKFGLTCRDYLEAEGEHVALNVEGASEEGGRLLVNSAQSLAGCCGYYVKLLQRYNYGFLSGSSTGGCASLESNKHSISAPNTATSKKPSLRRQNKSHDGAEAAQTDAQAQPGLDNLLIHLDGELIVPATSVPLDAAFVRQVAPKPTVGCELVFPTVAAGPVSPNGAPESPMRKRPSNGNSPTAASVRSKLKTERGGSLLDKLNLGKSREFLAGFENSVQSHGAHEAHHSNHHHKRHNHSHHHHNRRRSMVGRGSVVGGVIVPTIIHNDKMDEIETYDIIYRQPPVQAKESSSSSSSSSSVGDHDGERMDEVDKMLGARPESRFSHSSGSNRAAKSRRGADQMLLPNGAESSSGSGDSDEEEQRVERLSSEFEDRVRKEKNELRAKVDQIMNEIKLSAKSGKSSRFLASPVSLAAETKPGAGSAADERAPGGAESIAGRVLDKAGPGKQQQLEATRLGHKSSISSSGQSSCSASNSSSLSTGATSCSSRTTSCSSASSTNSATSTSSSTLRNGNGNTNNSDHKAAEPKSPGANSLGDLATQLVSKNTYGQTYLHFIASRSQCANTLYKVLDHGSHLIGERDVFYRTARDVAVQFNLPMNAQVLDKFIIDLFIGANTSLLRHLLNQGYSPLIHVSDPDGNDIMLILKLLKLDRMIHFLLQMADFQRWRDELHTFIRHGYSAGVSELIKRHKDLIKAKSVHSRTSLHLAVLFDRLEMVSELLEADPSSAFATDNMGRTALHYTYGLNLKNVEEIREKLLFCGASLETRDVKMRTPKYYYIFKREIEEIKRIELELN